MSHAPVVHVYQMQLPSHYMLQRNHFHNFPQFVLFDVLLDHIVNGVGIDNLIAQTSDGQVRSAEAVLMS